MKRVAFLKQNISTATEIQTILGLPDEAWKDLEVSFGHDGVAMARISLLLSRAQVVALANVLDDIGGQP